MKIAFISPDGLSTRIFCKSFGANLAERRDVEIYTISSIDGYDDDIEAIGSVHIPLEMERFVHPLKDLNYFFKLYQICRRERFDVVITFTTKPNLYGVLAAKLAGTPVVTMAIRGLGRVFNEPQGLSQRLIYSMTTGLYRVACRATNMVWMTNQTDRDFLVSNGFVKEGKTLLTSNAVDVKDFSSAATDPARTEALRAELGFSRDHKIIIMVARMIWPKGIKEFAEAAEMLKDDHPDYRFLLIAPLEENSPAAVPESYINDMKSRANLTWVPFRKDILTAYALADLSVLPSYYKEGGYPRALLEAMGLGKPVIAADTDECRGPVEDGRNGYLVPPKDAKALANRIVNILEDGELYESFGQRSLEKIQTQFDDRIVAGQVLSALNI
jgi:N,N'-diacetylbacillosaminyl-diphospho-undecaprenol alpha-1,3-N-acetylgalactosaminyltransferase